MAGPLNETISVYVYHHERTGALLQFFEYVSSAYESVLAIESTCLRSVGEHEEIEETIETKEEATRTKEGSRNIK